MLIPCQFIKLCVHVYIYVCVYVYDLLLKQLAFHTNSIYYVPPCSKLQSPNPFVSPAILWCTTKVNSKRLMETNHKTDTTNRTESRSGRYSTCCDQFVAVLTNRSDQGCISHSACYF